MSKKKVEREVRAAHRRNKKDKQHLGNDFDDFLSLNNQLGTMGLSLKQIPGDGNCLFRALGDQLDGNAGDHLHHRTNAVNYMRQHREDFEPFVEDDISFDSHLASLAENGTFGGNDSIVAFARLHDLTVVIHQLNKPLWQIHGGVGGNPGSQEVHISYHNGDHYNSVRRMGDLGNTPARIRLCLASKEERRTNTGYTNCDNYQEEEDPSPDSGQESDYENSPSNSKLNKLANEVSRLSGVDVKREVFDALEVNAYCVTAAVDYLLNDAVSLAKSNLWSSGGTGSRIFGDSAAVKAVTGRSPSRSAQEKLVNIQQKLQNKNLSNKKRKELKKNQRKLHANEDMKRGSAAGGINQCDDETDLVIANVEALTI
eukprot:GFUD01139018.1.p1 GENE.GFUD01139018.1~~GFUD01139018.1.p1  ORF type:complete len:370 (-),score=101.80 GFUD01139018.1:362-1471(-)